MEYFSVIKNMYFYFGEIMKKIITLMFFFVIGFVFFSCATKPDYIGKMIEKESLGKDTVILGILMAPRILQIFPLIDAGIYNSSIKNAEAELTEVENRKLQTVNKEFSERYSGVFNANVVTSNYNIKQDEIRINYFAEASQSTKGQLITLCEENRADIIVTIVGQVECTGVGIFGIKGANRMNIYICIFDNKGKVLAQSKLNTQRRISMAKDATVYGLLFEDGLTSLIRFIQELAS